MKSKILKWNMLSQSPFLGMEKLLITPTKVLHPKENLETKDDDKPSDVEEIEEIVYKHVTPFP